MYGGSLDNAEHSEVCRNVHHKSRCFIKFVTVFNERQVLMRACEYLVILVYKLMYIDIFSYNLPFYSPFLKPTFNLRQPPKLQLPSTLYLMLTNGRNTCQTKRSNLMRACDWLNLYEMFHIFIGRRSIVMPARDFTRISL